MVHRRSLAAWARRSCRNVSCVHAGTGMFFIGEPASVEFDNVHPSDCNTDIEAIYAADWQSVRWSDWADSGDLFGEGDVYDLVAAENRIIHALIGDDPAQWCFSACICCCDSHDRDVLPEWATAANVNPVDAIVGDLLMDIGVKTERMEAELDLLSSRLRALPASPEKLQLTNDLAGLTDSFNWYDAEVATVRTRVRDMVSGMIGRLDVASGNSCAGGMTSSPDVGLDSSRINIGGFMTQSGSGKARELRRVPGFRKGPRRTRKGAD